jgi:hypothetical protein
MTVEYQEIRNPFNVMDVPEPDDQDVQMFTAAASLEGGADDANAQPWKIPDERGHAVEGYWSSRWNGGADPAIPGDAKEKWKHGCAQIRVVGDRMYLLFDWHRGARRGLIDVKRKGADRLIGKYINLTNPAITRPWIGLIVSDDRIDGRWTEGRLDFRR